MDKIAREKYLASGWKNEEKENTKKDVSDIKNDNRNYIARLKWARQASKWGHLHPKRGY